MSKRTNCTKNGVDYYKINRKVGKKINKNGKLVSEMKTFYGHSRKEAEEKYLDYISHQVKANADIMNKPLYVAIDNWIDSFLITILH